MGAITNIDEPKIVYEGNELPFENLREVSILVEGKPWVYEHRTDKQLQFKPAPMGGYAGMGNYLKQWRKRRKTGGDGKSAGKRTTQTQAAKMFGVSQSFIAKIEKGERQLPVEIFKRIHRDVLKHGRATPFGE